MRLRSERPLHARRPGVKIQKRECRFLTFPSKYVKGYLQIW